VVDKTVMIEEEILVAERNAALLAAFAELPLFYQQLLSMLMAEPSYSYAEISAKLGIPVGSIGPQRARGLERLRRSAVLKALGNDDIVNIPGGEPGA
jgi:DNA-directed RNA polymerase specialized sigma24 family protein